MKNRPARASKMRAESPRTHKLRFVPAPAPRPELDKKVSHVPGLEQMLVWAEKQAAHHWGRGEPMARMVIDAGSGIKLTVEMPQEAGEEIRRVAR